MFNRAALLLVAGLWLLTGCGGGGGGTNTTPNPVSVTINSTNADISIGATQAFTASVANATNTAVTWSIQEGLAGGAIDAAAGTYVAPSVAGTYHIIATSKADTGKSATFAVTVHLVISAAPPSATVTLGQSQTFSTTIQGWANTTVTWSVQEGASGGTVNATGTYTAPSAPGTYHIVATSQADPTQKATINVLVVAGSATGTIQ